MIMLTLFALLGVVQHSLSVPLDCSPRVYGFSTIRTGSSFTKSADGAWLMHVTPAENREVECSAIFDSAIPPASELDLGTPGECDGGPGQGLGGRQGEPGENCEALGKLLLCHGGDITTFRSCKCNRYACEDCQPDDRSSGAVFTMTFQVAVRFMDFTVVDLDGNSALSITFPGGSQTTIDGLGDNSVQTVVLDRSFDAGDELVIECKESCAMAEFRINVCTPEPDVEITKLLKRTFSATAATEETFTDDDLDSEFDAAATAIPIPESQDTPQRKKITVDLGGKSKKAASATETGGPAIAGTAQEATPTAEETAELETTGTKSILGTLTTTFEPEASPGVTPEESAELAVPGAIAAPSTTPSINLSASVEPTPSKLPPPSESSQPVCFEDSPITFDYLPVGAGAFEGRGYKLYTRRIGLGEVQDVSAVFDTEDPPASDLDLGSPNVLCGNGGPGQGKGGAPGRLGENCIPLGHVLIAHSGNVTELRAVCAKNRTSEACAPNDASGGAEFVFTFTEDAVLRDVVVLDVDEIPRSLIITYPDGKKKQYAGLGENGKLMVGLGYAKVTNGDLFKIYCSGSCALVRVDRTLCSSTPSPTPSPTPSLSASPSPICRTVVENFEDRRTGFEITSGYHWELKTCRFQPDGDKCGVSAAFNTSDPVISDLDLGSPNEKCPGGGRGVGAGGEPGNKGENCAPQGQVLIAAEGIIEYLRYDCTVGYCQPNDHAGGARFTFTFDRPATIESITMLDLDEAEGSAVLEFHDGHQMRLSGLGDNSVSVVDLSSMASKHASIEANQSFAIRCSSSCAISEFNYTLCV